MMERITPGIIFPPGYIEHEDFVYSDEDIDLVEDVEDEFSDVDDEMEVPLEIIGIVQRTRVGDQGQIVIDIEIELEDLDAVSVDVRCSPA